MAALRQQPGLERGARGEVHALKQVATEARHSGALQPRPASDRPYVNERVAWEPQSYLFALQRLPLAEQATQLGEIPAQRSERIVRFAE